MDTSDWKFMVCKIHRPQYQCAGKTRHNFPTTSIHFSECELYALYHGNFYTFRPHPLPLKSTQLSVTRRKEREGQMRRRRNSLNH